MEKMNFQEVRFLNTSMNDAILTLWVNCSHTTTHILIAVRQRGHKHYDEISIFNMFNTSRMSVLRLPGYLRNRNYDLVICGLGRVRGTGCHRQSKDLSLYSVTGVATYSIIIPFGEKQDATIYLTAAAHERLMKEIESEEYEEFLIEVNADHYLPMNHSLKVTAPFSCTGGMYIVSDMKRGLEHVMVCDRAASLVPLLPIHQSRTEYTVKAMALTDSEKLYVLPPRHSSTSTVTMVTEETDSDNYVLTSHSCSAISKTVTIKTDNSIDDLYQLMEKAKSYCNVQTRRPAWYEITQFYRDKSEDYINDILVNKDAIMEKYRKDNNGDKFCPINHKIDGLFFSASLVVKTKQPRTCSLFGDTRIFIPAEQFITPDMCMYFADFYCHYDTHYVTIVMTKIGSKEDDFCRHRLPQLNLQDNRFFIVKLDPNTGNEIFKMASIKQFHVEFLYTENIDISWLRREKVIGLGESKADGIPKKEGCPICNLEMDRSTLSQMTIPGFGALKL